MARATRVDFPGALYHVLNRGIERRAIFRSTRCCQKFIQLLSSLPERFGVRLHGYALMGNHYHLQLEGGSQRGSRLYKTQMPIKEMGIFWSALIAPNASQSFSRWAEYYPPLSFV